MPGGLILKDPSQINTEKGSKKVVMLLDGASINKLQPETLQAVKTASFVITDVEFVFQQYVQKLETLIEEDKENA